MGGKVGMKLAIDRPELVRRLTVIGSPPLGPSAMGPSPAEAIRLIEGYYRGSGPSIEKMRQQFEGDHRDEIDSMMNMIRANLDEPITDKGNEARMPYGDRFEVKFVLEEGKWKIQDLD